MKKVLSILLASSVLSSLIACGGSNPQSFAAMNMMGSAPQMNAMRAPVMFNGMNNASTGSAKMRLATYNIRNLFDGIQNPGKEPEKAKPEKELQALSEAMHHINADVMGLQEVESKEVLTQFRDRFLGDMGYREVVLIEGNDARGIDVALFSRYPVLDVKSHKDARFDVPGQGVMGLSRDLLQVRLQGPNNYIFTMFVTHLKSHHGDAPADVRRHAEALKVREIIDQFSAQNPRENVVLVGDFNDPPRSPHIGPITQPPARGGMNLTDLILQDLGEQDWVYTYHPQKYRSRIDYILLNDNMKNEYIPRSVQLYKPHKEGNDWKELYFYNASDHIPVTVELDVSTDR